MCVAENAQATPAEIVACPPLTAFKQADQGKPG